jgi:hypothetical protein
VLELLEDRTVLNSYTAGTVTDLINYISDANLHPGSNTITLVSNTTFTLTAPNNTTDGSGNGLPVIAANNSLTIQGNGDSIGRSTATGTPAFRLFDVAAGAALTLTNLTLANGQVVGGAGMNAMGGGIYSSGLLTLTNVTLSSNSAQGGSGGDCTVSNAYGGGLYVAGGTATLSNATLSFNSAIGGLDRSGSGDSGKGGGVYVETGTVSLTNVTLSSNSAIGRDGVSGGDGEGGGVYVAGGTVSLANDTISSNTAVGGDSTGKTGKWPGAAGAGGGMYLAGGTVTLSYDTVICNTARGGDNSKGLGGGLFIDPAATVYLDAFTLNHTKSNHPDNIYKRLSPPPT